MTQDNNFKALGLSEKMLNAIAKKGFETPTPIQTLVIPKLLNGENDIIAQSQTGTGKTATFGLPIMQKITPKEGGVKAIILVPTRELAIQAAEELQSFNSELRLSITAIYGGASMTEQLRRLSKGVDIVVGTPGRTLDHIRRGTLKLNRVQYLILDEADEMLNMGFIEDVEEIMSNITENRRVMLFSATMPKRIIKLSERYMQSPELVKIEATQLTTELTDQIYFEVRESDKFDALTRIIDIQNEFYGIVFCRTKVTVDQVVARLSERGYAADGLHGDVSQVQREKILKKFRAKSINILVATDVAARGIDVNDLTHVINFSLPQDSESYVHRIGRTGRAGKQGTAITFITRSEMRQFGFLKRDINVDIKREELPNAQDILAMKRNKIKDDLQEIVQNDIVDDYNDMAEELLKLYTPEVALSALLRLAFRSELDENKYPEIRSFSVDRKGAARLFIAIGKRDGHSAKSISELLKDKCELEDKHIDDIRVMDNFSFVTVPFTDAQKVIAQLGAHKGRPMAEIASEEGGSTPKKEGRGGGRRGGDRNGSDRRGGERRDRRSSDRKDRRGGDSRGGENRDRGSRDSQQGLGADFDWAIYDNGGKGRRGGDGNRGGGNRGGSRDNRGGGRDRRRK